MDSDRTIKLADLLAGFPGITPRRGAEHYEATLVCLTERSHEPGVKCDVKDMNETRTGLALHWSEQVTEQMKSSWNDLGEATESGAVGIAILVILELTEYTIIRRSKKGTGVDYWLGFKNVGASVGENVLKDNARLEVSGIGNANQESTIRARVRNKLRRTSRSDSARVPAYVIVTEFSRPVVYMVERAAD